MRLESARPVRGGMPFFLSRGFHYRKKENLGTMSAEGGSASLQGVLQKKAQLEQELREVSCQLLQSSSAVHSAPSLVLLLRASLSGRASACLADPS